MESEKKYIEQICDIFREKDADVYFVELEADLSVRLKRNETEFRLSQKLPKRDIEKSKENLLASEKHQLNTNGDFFYTENYLKLNNTDLSAEETARIIVEKFRFLRVDS